MTTKMNSQISREYWGATCASPNLDVGRVINAFQKFSSTLVWANEWEAGNEESGKKAREVFELVFTGAHSEEYRPLPRKCASNGAVVAPIMAEQIPDLFGRVAAMKLTVQNVRYASRDLQAVARIYAEQTIDAAKTGMEVVVENLEGLRKVLSNCKAPVETKISFEEQKVESEVLNKSLLTRAEKVNGIVIDDIFHCVREGGREAVRQIAARMAEKKQGFEEGSLQKIRERVEAIGGYKRIVADVRFVKQVYQSVAQAYRNKIEALRWVFMKSPEDKASILAAIKPAVDAQYDGLRNMLRCVLKSFSAVDRVCIGLYVAYDMDLPAQKRDGEASDFVSALLEEEFFVYALKVAASKGGDKIGSAPLYAEDPLEYVRGFEEGDIVEFTVGEAEVDGKYARAKSFKLEGSFEIRKNAKGEWVACRDLESLIVIPEPDENKIVLMSSSAVGNFVSSNELVPGREVFVVGYHKLSGTKNSVVAGGKQLFTYRKEKDGAIEEMYASRKGNIVDTFVGGISIDGKNYQAAFITVDVTGKVSMSELDKMGIEAKAAETKGGFRRKAKVAAVAI